jgi:hypothetical protein
VAPRPLLAALLFCLAGAASAAPVPYDELLAAMKAVQGYNLLATTNAARFNAEVILRLARRARARDPRGESFTILQKDWFKAYLAATGATEQTAPEFARLQAKMGQDYAVDCRADRVIHKVEKGDAPDLAVNVTFSWPAAPGVPEQYSYEDVLSTPKLHVTNLRLIRYRLLEYPDQIVFDQIEGFKGRPTSGALGVLFSIIGEGRLVQYRMAVGPGGVVVARGRSSKAFLEIGATVTVQPDGRSEKGVPNDPALRALEKTVTAPLSLDYEPWPASTETLLK